MNMVASVRQTVEPLSTVVTALCTNPSARTRSALSDSYPAVSPQIMPLGNDDDLHMERG